MFGHTKTLHTLVGKGSAALAAVVPYAGKRHEFPARELVNTVSWCFEASPPHRVISGLSYKGQGSTKEEEEDRDT